MWRGFLPGGIQPGGGLVLPALVLLSLWTVESFFNNYPLLLVAYPLITVKKQEKFSDKSGGWSPGIGTVPRGN